MCDRAKLTTTLGILIAGLFEAEEAVAESERGSRHPLPSASGTFPLGDALYGTDMPPENSPGEDGAMPSDDASDARAFAADAGQSAGGNN